MKFLYGTLIFLSGFILKAQISVHSYTMSSNYWTGGIITPAEDSGFVSVIRLSDYAVRLIKFTSGGNITWAKKIYPLFGSVIDVLPMGNYYYMTGYTADDRFQLIRLDKFGNVQWRKLYAHPSYPGNGAHFGFSLHKVSEKNLLINGVYESQPGGTPIVTVMKVDTSGNLIWTKQYNNTFAYGRAGTGKDRSILITRSGYDILNLDTLGNVKYSLTQNGYIPTYSSATGGVSTGIFLSSFLQSDSNFIYKLGPTGTLLFTTKFIRMNPNNMIEYNDHALVCGTTFQNDLTYISFCEVTNNGEILSHRLIPSEAGLVSARIVKDLNGRFAIIAMYYNTFKIYTFSNHGNPACSSFTISALTTSGSISFSPSPCIPSPIVYSTMVSSAFQNIENIESELICESGIVTGLNSFENTGDMIIYPNPSEGVFKIRSEVGRGGSFSVYNVQGVEIFHSTSNGKEFELDLSENPKGLYLICLRHETGIIMRHFLIE